MGLLSYDEVVYVGGYDNQMNNNYYLFNPTIHFWTMSPAGFSIGAYVWLINAGGNLSYNPVNTTYAVRPVINLTVNTQISDGDGTKDNPFIVE